MTLIVASLFLPYTVEFELEGTEGVEELAETQPIAIPKQRTSSINASSTQIPTVGSILHKPVTEMKPAPSSGEDFFLSHQGSPQSSTPTLGRMDSNNFSPLVGSAPVINSQSLTSAYDMSMNRSTPGFSLNSTPDQATAQMKDINERFSKPFLPRNNSSTSFIPKSRVSTSPHSAVTEAAAKKNVAYDTGLPAVKRVLPKSKLQMSIDDTLDDTSQDSLFDEGTSENTENFQDDNYDSNQHYDIPKFGGFSKKKLLNKEEKSNIFEKSPFNVVEFAKGNGGLKNAIKSSLEDGIVKDFKWLGTIGIPTDELTQKTKEKIVNKLKAEYNSESVLPSDFTFQGHYKSFCKQILWPTFHYQIPDNPNSKAFEDHSWEYYKSLNQQFADKIIEIYEEGDTIWVHDYHLLLVPQMVRSKLPNAKIGFFLHVSFPSSEVFRCLAQRESLLKGILGANSIAFQTDEYVRHFLQTCNKLLLADISDNELRYKGQTVKVCAQPVGIDAAKLVKQIHSEEVQAWRAMIRKKWDGKKLIVGRDKFDRIRGVKQKLLAYETFLQQNPEYVEDTVLIQICLKSSSVDGALESEIMSIVDRINSLSQNISNSQPVVFLHQDIDFVQYLGLISEADTFIVSSMREGMNLTCHEFIVATMEKKSPLILSEFTGSAAVFTKGALLINPWDKKQVTQSYLTALTMSQEEKEKNWRLLYDVVSHQDCDYWVETSLKFIDDSWTYQHEKEAYFTLDVPKFTEAYKNSKDRLFIFLLSQTPTTRMKHILTDLSATNTVYVLSTDVRAVMDRNYRDVPGVGLIAECGSFLKLKDGGPWTALHSGDMSSWMESTLEVAKSYEERLPGSKAQGYETSIRFFTKHVPDRDRAQTTIGDLIAHVNNIEQNIHATLVDDTLYIQESGITLKAVTYLIDYMTKTGKLNDEMKVMLSSNPPSPVARVEPKPLEFVCIGGDANNLVEPVLDYVNQLGNDGIVENTFTVAFGGSVSNAKEHVEGFNELFSIVEKMI